MESIMPNDNFDNFLKENSQQAPKKHGSEFAQILNKIESAKPSWKTTLGLWLTVAVTCAFIGVISIGSFKTGATSPEELAKLEAYIEAEFYDVSHTEYEDYY